MPNKKPKYACKFNKAWLKEYQFIQPVSTDNTSAHCTWCKSSFSVGAGGKNDITRHCESVKHKTYAKSIKKTSSLTSFFSAGDRQQDEVSVCVLGLVGELGVVSFLFYINFVSLTYFYFEQLKSLLIDETLIQFKYMNSNQKERQNECTTIRKRFVP